MRPLLVAIAALPHALVAVVLARDNGVSWFLIGLVLWNLVPVAVGGLLLYRWPPAYGSGWLLTTLVGSSFAAWVGALAPHGSTSVLVFLFFPLWNLLLIGPATLVAVQLMRSWRR